MSVSPGDRIWQLVATYRSWFIPPADDTALWTDEYQAEVDDYLRDVTP